jgi:Holliday junction DNA helicase RuvA
MIARLKGLLAVKETERLIIDVNGVGYAVNAPYSTFYALPDTEQEIELLIHTHVTTDAISLYGFLTKPELDLFRMLISVSRIGPKVGINILSGIEPDELINALATGDVARLVRIPGIGKKAAERMIVDLKDKILQISTSAKPEAIKLIPDKISDDAVSALINLGYNKASAEKAVIAAMKETGEEAIIEDIIRQALKRLAR